MDVYAEYVWIDAAGAPRSKMRVISVSADRSVMETLLQKPWNFDGSSTNQNVGPNPRDTEVVLRPVRVVQSPFSVAATVAKQSPAAAENDRNAARHCCMLVLCELAFTYDPKAKDPVLNDDQREVPIPVIGINTRRWAAWVAEELPRAKSLGAWFGIEQEYVFTKRSLKNGKERPYGWRALSKHGQGPFYCSVQAPYSSGLLSSIAHRHAQMCTEMGLRYGGLNAEVLPGQWEFQVGPGPLLGVADDLVLARYVLVRLAAEHGLGVSFAPKPVAGEWNGSGAHINFSTHDTRRTIENGEKVGLSYLHLCISRLDAHHRSLLGFYGDGNEQRLCGKHETSSMDRFSWGVGTRHTSVRIPNMVEHDGGGYAEDRRPAANIDPYLALGSLLDVISGGTGPVLWARRAALDAVSGKASVVQEECHEGARWELFSSIHRAAAGGSDDTSEDEGRDDNEKEAFVDRVRP